MTIEHAWQGAVTESSIWVRTKITGLEARLVVADNPELTDPTFYAGNDPTADGMVSLRANALAADQRWWWAIEEDSVVSDDARGTFRTAPPLGQPASFTFAAIGDAGQGSGSGAAFVDQRQSNHPVFDELHDRALAEEWLFAVHLGDAHYRDIGTADIAQFRTAYDDMLTFNGTLGLAARQGRCWRNLPITYVWDDHDYGPNNSDKTAPGRDEACQAYRERAPHYPLPDTDPTGQIYQPWQVGRVLFIANDTRSERDPNDDDDLPGKSMLGAGQVDWMEQLLASTSAEALVWCMSKPFPGTIGGGGDSWGRFGFERDRLIEMLRDLGWVNRMLVLSADGHYLAADTGAAWNRIDGQAGPPSFVCASLDANPGDPSPLWDLGHQGGRNQYTTVSIDDDGEQIRVTWSGWVGDEA